MNVQVDVKAAEVLLKLRNGAKRMVYAISNSTNNTAKEVQRVERERAASTFTLRDKREFLLRQVAVIRFARPKEGTVDALVSVGQKPGLFLAGYEAGFERKAKAGGKVAVPVTARPSKTAPIPQELYVRRLGLTRSGKGRGKRKGGASMGGSIRGRVRSYMIKGIGIFQQQPGPAPATLLYAFKAPFQVSARLGWHRAARATVDRFFAPELRRQIYETLRFNRGR